MYKILSRVLSFLILLVIPLYTSGQEHEGSHGLPGTVVDSLLKTGYVFIENKRPDTIDFSHEQAIEFLQRKIRPRYWKDPADPLRVALSQLVFEASHDIYDSAQVYLEKFPFDSLRVPWDKFFIWEPLRLKIPVISQTEAMVTKDSMAVADTTTLPERADSLDIPVKPHTTEALFRDTTILVVIDTLYRVDTHDQHTPFAYYDYPYQADSIITAVGILMNYVEARDSSLIYFTGAGDDMTPVWLNSTTGRMHRYWLKTDLYDSVTVWIGSQGRNKIALYLENGISFIRPSRQELYADPSVEIKEIDRSKLREVRKIIVKPQYWTYRSEAAFALNQASLTNWVKGGESNLSTSLDITGFADYNNTHVKVTSKNFARLKYGLIWTDEDGIRKNLDLLETNSKLNHKAFGKFDFSAIMLFKTQLAKGFTYPNDTTRNLVSKFFNPATITVGLGLDYKPNKLTSINLSPLSYKGTFVPDTTGIKGIDAIDQTKYGVPSDKRAKHEPGASFMISHEYRPRNNIKIINRLQLFTNYIHNPLNIDVDWEMILTANLNWFTDVRFNTHLIFDDDTKSPLFDKDDNPVLNPDGKQKKTARIQFKELLGFSFVFRF
ncbi:MAG TPA: DUF3078 domain-containing protein [Bacteroidales bacterium]|nr:DUF3078 domain-containing protein [Bacteroidales bacterium]HPJ59259.1 DUF3078 domain-containing protein [Bacteroidales bacterium]HRW84410.1 DUF3078 domain-containing protein [Bacteroidales bacterium]